MHAAAPPRARSAASPRVAARSCSAAAARRARPAAPRRRACGRAGAGSRAAAGRGGSVAGDTSERARRGPSTPTLAVARQPLEDRAQPLGCCMAHRARVIALRIDAHSDVASCANLGHILRKNERDRARDRKPAGGLAQRRRHARRRSRPSSPPPGARVAVIGCGTSLLHRPGRAATLRESLRPRRDATRSWPPRCRTGRSYDVVRRDLPLRHDDRGRARARGAARRARRSLAIIGRRRTPVVAGRARRRSCSPSPTRRRSCRRGSRRPRSPCCARTSGESLDTAIADAEAAARAPRLPIGPLRLRAVRLPRHGLDGRDWRTRPPSSSARRPAPGPRRIRRWSTGTGRSASPATARSCGCWARSTPDLADDIRTTGATVIESTADPMAELVHDPADGRGARRVPRASTPTGRDTSPDRWCSHESAIAA